jgi:hypothetical protein
MALTPGYIASFDETDALSPARRAAVLMGILGLIGVMGGVCLGILGLALPDVMTQPEFARVLRPGLVTFPSMQSWMVVGGVVCCFGASAFAFAGYFVRKGTTGPIVVAILLTMLALVATGFILIATLFVARAQNDVTIISAEWMLVLPVVFLVILLIWLTAALHNVSYLRSIRNGRQVVSAG